MHKSIRLSDQYEIRGNQLFVWCVLDKGAPRDDWGSYDYTNYGFKPSKYKIGQLAVLGSLTNLTPNAIREGRDVPSYFLDFDLEGIGGNSDHTIKRTSGWRGTTDDWSCDAHGIVEIVGFRKLKNGSISVSVKSVHV